MSVCPHHAPYAVENSDIKTNAAILAPTLTFKKLMNASITQPVFVADCVARVEAVWYMLSSSTADSTLKFLCADPESVTASQNC